MDSIVIVAAARTPLGAFNGKLKSVSAVELGSAVIRKVTKDYNANIDSVYMGCVLSAGLGQSAARQTTIGAELNTSVNCINVNKICGSGMAALMLARNAIISGENEVAVAGGMESMTNAPYLLEKARSGYRFGDKKITDHIVKDGLMDAYKKCVMGYYAEDIAAAYSFTREDQDSYTIKSFMKSRKSIEDGIFKKEIIPVTTESRVIDADEIPFSVNLEKVPHLKPAFKEGGTITAASASSIADGAAAMLVMKESKAAQLQLTPLVRIVAQSSFSQTPELFATSPIGAIKQVLKKSKWSIDDVDIFEINEAFAVVPMAVIKELSIDCEKVNVLGGACAIGHPLGASGARIITTLISAMKNKNAKNGLATLCVGGGEGVAMTFSRL